jgi:Cu+-exporting ATPase
MGLQAKFARVWRDDVEQDIPVDDAGGRHRDCAPEGSCGRVVTDGRTLVDESMLTGESLPVEKRPGER